MPTATVTTKVVEEVATSMLRRYEDVLEMFKVAGVQQPFDICQVKDRSNNANAFSPTKVDKDSCTPRIGHSDQHHTKPSLSTDRSLANSTPTSERSLSPRMSVAKDTAQDVTKVNVVATTKATVTTCLDTKDDNLKSSSRSQIKCMENQKQPQKMHSRKKPTESPKENGPVETNKYSRNISTKVNSSQSSDRFQHHVQENTGIRFSLTSTVYSPPRAISIENSEASNRLSYSTGRLPSQSLPGAHHSSSPTGLSISSSMDSYFFNTPHSTAKSSPKKRMRSDSPREHHTRSKRCNRKIFLIKELETDQERQWQQCFHTPSALFKRVEWPRTLALSGDLHLGPFASMASSVMRIAGQAGLLDGGVATDNNHPTQTFLSRFKSQIPQTETWQSSLSQDLCVGLGWNHQEVSMILEVQDSWDCTLNTYLSQRHDIASKLLIAFLKQSDKEGMGSPTHTRIKCLEARCFLRNLKHYEGCTLESDITWLKCCGYLSSNDHNMMWQVLQSIPFSSGCGIIRPAWQGSGNVPHVRVFDCGVTHTDKTSKIALHKGIDVLVIVSETAASALLKQQEQVQNAMVLARTIGLLGDEDAEGDSNMEYFEMPNNRMSRLVTLSPVVDLQLTADSGEGRSERLTTVDLKVVHCSMHNPWPIVSYFSLPSTLIHEVSKQVSVFLGADTPVLKCPGCMAFMFLVEQFIANLPPGLTVNCFVDLVTVLNSGLEI